MKLTNRLSTFASISFLSLVNASIDHHNDNQINTEISSSFERSSLINHQSPEKRQLKSYKSSKAKTKSSKTSKKAKKGKSKSSKSSKSLTKPDPTTTTSFPSKNPSTSPSQLPTTFPSEAPSKTPTTSAPITEPPTFLNCSGVSCVGVNRYESNGTYLEDIIASMVANQDFSSYCQDDFDTAKAWFIDPANHPDDGKQNDDHYMKVRRE